MSGFTDRFGGDAINPSDVAYKKYSLSAGLTTFWPPYANANNVMARTMDVVTTISGINIKMPDAREASPGETVLFYNNGSFAYNVIGFQNLAIATVQPGDRRFIELTDNITADGAWVTTQLGVGVGSLDVAGAAGAGLKAIGPTLNVAYIVDTVTSSRNIFAQDRDHVLVWTGGVGTLVLPSTANDFVDFNFEIRNQGTGTLTLQTTGGELIDGATTQVYNTTESAWIHADQGAWYTVGRGRNAQFNFTQLQKTVTGGTYIETLTEAANVVQTFTGVLTSDFTLVLPSVVQIYYIANQTTGSFNFLIKNAGPGTTLSLPAGQTAVVFSDGTNVSNASTSTSGATQFVYGAGTATAPSIGIGAANTGFYSPGAGQVAFTSGGQAVFVMLPLGTLVSGPGNMSMNIASTAAQASLNISRPAGSPGQISISTLNSPRWVMAADGATESGGNVGSNFVINRYTDAGTLIDSSVSINRFSGTVTVAKGLRDLQALGQILAFIGPPNGKPGFLYLNGALVSRTAYADLWAYANSSGSLVTEDQWVNQGYWGRFSVGDGSTTFRIPDLRGVFIRGFDNGRSLDANREWGKFQNSANLSHSHAVYDPGHNHNVNDPGHGHALSDPSHAHAGNTDGQGNHAHKYTAPQISPAGATLGPSARVVDGDVDRFTDNQGWHVHNFATDYRGTGIALYNNYTGIYLSAAVSNIGIYVDGAVEARPANQAFPLYVRY